MPAQPAPGECRLKQESNQAGYLKGGWQQTINVFWCRGIFRILANELVQRYQTAGPQGKSQMEYEYGKVNLEKLIEENASNQFIGSQCKPCPNCKSPIQVRSICSWAKRPIGLAVSLM